MGIGGKGNDGGIPTSRNFEQFYTGYPVPVLRIRIHRIHMFLGLLDPDPLVRGMDPDPDPFIIKQKYSMKDLDFYNSIASKRNMQKNFFFKLVFCWRLEGQ
jgi:hypothetical protein